MLFNVRNILVLLIIFSAKLSFAEFCPSQETVFEALARNSGEIYDIRHRSCHDISSEMHEALCAESNALDAYENSGKEFMALEMNSIQGANDNTGATHTGIYVISEALRALSSKNINISSVIIDRSGEYNRSDVCVYNLTFENTGDEPPEHGLEYSISYHGRYHRDHNMMLSAHPAYSGSKNADALNRDLTGNLKAFMESQFDILTTRMAGHFETVNDRLTGLETRVANLESERS